MFLPLIFCRLFKLYLVLVLINQMTSALFRFIAAAGRNLIVVNSFGLFVLLALYASGGFILSRGMMSIISYLKTIFFCQTWRNSFFVLFVVEWNRTNKEMVEMGLLGFTIDVRAERNSSE